MKHLKSFEVVESIREGDYLLLYTKHFKDAYTTDDLKVRVLDIVEEQNQFGGVKLFYNVLASDGMDVFIHKSWIKRRLTSGEIKQYELELDSHKYNL